MRIISGGGDGRPGHYSLMQVEMKPLVVLMAALLSLGCTGLPVLNSELKAAASRGLGAALAKVNSVYAVSRLYRATGGSVSKVIAGGLNTVDMLIKFGIKETECAKDSRNDPETCVFRPGFLVPSFSCSTRVRMTITSAQVVSLRCSQDSSSSSSESSEEVLSRGRSHFIVPVVNRETTPPPPTLPNHSHLSPAEDVQPRGDTFSNYLV